jgi:hypothetical protein
MNDNYGMADCPIPAPETEFKYTEYDVASNFEIEFGVGVDDHKYDCKSYVDVNADLGGAYGMDVAIKNQNGEWIALEEIRAVRVIIRGEYERNSFRHALQKVGLMTLPIYGKMKTPEEQWKEENAIREQT